MPKMKTHSGAAKRFKRTKNGFKFRQANHGHNTGKKTGKLKRALHAMGEVAKVDIRMMERLLVSCVLKRRKVKSAAQLQKRHEEVNNG